MMALSAAVLPAERRASGLALVATAASLARLVGSIGFGLLWSQWGIAVALGGFASLLLLALGLAAPSLLRNEPLR
jgi:hypothetical protein